MNKNEVLKQIYGYEEFRTGQAELIDAILEKKDVVGIMPTGAGKSVCFQVPAIMSNGITLVISPLISLMKDQVFTLIELGVKTAYINSSLSSSQITEALRRAKQGAYKIMYIAPERLLTQEFLDFAKEVDISMITIDEAHCISQWGQDFRPSYAKIPEFIKQLGKRPVISAFTATATSKVKDDIIEILELKNPKELITGFDRTNIFFSVERESNKKEAICKYVEERKEKVGIVYAISRKGVDEICEMLCKKGYSATKYHAGLSDDERKQNQENFLFDRKNVMVATNAFGMGIDKSNVSYVVHANMPKDLESYYQEAGRAGRDGSEVEALLLYSGSDVATNEWLISNQTREVEDRKTLEILIEQDRQRLKQMTFYSTTNDCLREFILRYFGEQPKNFCGKCSNCLTKFEEIDIIEESKKILQCVKQLNQRFGMTMVIDVLRGSKNAKITKFKFDQLPMYGQITGKNNHTLITIINYLVQNNYLIKTAEQYPVIQIGDRAKELFSEEATLIIKIAQEKEPVAKKATKVVDANINVDNNLFEILKKVRRELAEKQHVPAFVVFSDKTLMHMSDKKPITKIEFLNVSGVGEAKCDKYGDVFIEAIKEYVR